MSKYINFHEKFQSMKEGGGKGGGSSINKQVAQAAEEAKFKPFTLTTGSGTAYGNANNEFGATANEQFSNLQGQSLAGANQLVGGISNAFMQQPNQFGYGANVQDLQRRAYEQAVGTQFGGFDNQQINSLQNAAVNQSLNPAAQFSAPNFDVQGRTNELFGQQRELLDPAFAQQRSQLESDLFGSGRLGLRIASEGAGAGTDGFVNPDAFGLGRAQSQALADAAFNARNQAFGEQQAQFGQELQGFGANQSAQQQQLANQQALQSSLFGQQLQGFDAQQGSAQQLAGLGGTLGQQNLSVFGANENLQNQYRQGLLQAGTGLFGMGTGVASLENELLKLGLSAEQARAMSAANAGQMLASGKEEKKDGKGFLGSVVGAAGQVGAASIYAGSDIRLKNNIVLVETDDAGISWYTWEWNDIAKELGLDSSNPYGVMAQEVMHIVPEAVIMGDDGYYRVDYNKVAGGTK